jgi:hypothetical protein
MADPFRLNQGMSSFGTLRTRYLGLLNMGTVDVPRRRWISPPDPMETFRWLAQDHADQLAHLIPEPIVIASPSPERHASG